MVLVSDDRLFRQFELVGDDIDGLRDHFLQLRALVVEAQVASGGLVIVLGV